MRQRLAPSQANTVKEGDGETTQEQVGRCFGNLAARRFGQFSTSLGSTYKPQMQSRRDRRMPGVASKRRELRSWRFFASAVGLSPRHLLHRFQIDQALPDVGHDQVWSSNRASEGATRIRSRRTMSERVTTWRERRAAAGGRAATSARRGATQILVLASLSSVRLISSELYAPFSVTRWSDLEWSR